ncbi:MAG: hypothetical protein VB140_06340 [Burkholderia sp.]
MRVNVNGFRSIYATTPLRVVVVGTFFAIYAIYRLAKVLHFRFEAADTPHPLG